MSTYYEIVATYRDGSVERLGWSARVARGAIFSVASKSKSARLLAELDAVAEADCRWTRIGGKPAWVSPVVTLRYGLAK